LSNPNTRTSADDVPAFLGKIFETVTSLVGGLTEPAPAEPATEYTRAVTARKSLADPDHIISMIDGKPYKTLRRHLSANGVTPEEYRARYNLKADYPMVAPNYSDRRRETAMKIGLGRKRSADVEATTTEPDPASESAPRKRKAETKAE
jgi:predicted transcriptional regulator